MESDAIRAREIHLPGLRGYLADPGVVLRTAARLCWAEPPGHDPVREVRAAPAAQSTSGAVCPRRREPSLSTLADQVGGCAVVLRPLYELICAHVFAAGRVHGDDTPVPVLAKGKTATGRARRERLAICRARVTPLVFDLETWMRTERAKLSRHAEVAKAMDYMLKRWTAFTRFLDDGRICLTNNAAARELRGIALGRTLPSRRHRWPLGLCRVPRGYRRSKARTPRRIQRLALRRQSARKLDQLVLRRCCGKTAFDQCRQLFTRALRSTCHGVSIAQSSAAKTIKIGATFFL